MNLRTYSKKGRFAKTLCSKESLESNCRELCVLTQFDFDDEETPKKRQLIRQQAIDSDDEFVGEVKKRRLIRRSDRNSEDAEVKEEPQARRVRVPVEENEITRQLREKIEKKKRLKKKELHGYENDGVVQDDDEETLFFDKTDVTKITDDTLTPEERAEVNAQIARDAYGDDEPDKSIEENRENFKHAAVVRHVTLDATLDMKTALKVFFSGEGEVDKFLVKFDDLLVNKTFSTFRSSRHQSTVDAALAIGIWRSEEMDESRVSVCLFCGILRKSCRDVIICKRTDKCIGYVGSECICRWRLMEEVHTLRRRLLSEFASGIDDEQIIEDYANKIDKLRVKIIKTLQLMQNKWPKK